MTKKKPAAEPRKHLKATTEDARLVSLLHQLPRRAQRVLRDVIHYTLYLYGLESRPPRATRA